MYLTPYLLPFAITCILIELTPGPNMGYLAIVSATNGRKAGLATTLGIATGLLTIGIAAVFGLAALISSSPTLYQLLRWGGVAYLLWLAWEGWRGADPNLSLGDQNEVEHEKFFYRGFVTNLLNPKAGLFYIAVLPSYVDPLLSIISQTVLLVVVYVLIATIIHTTIVMMAVAARVFLKDPIKAKFVQRVLSVLLAFIAVWFAWTTKL